MLAGFFARKEGQLSRRDERKINAAARERFAHEVGNSPEILRDDVGARFAEQRQNLLAERRLLEAIDRAVVVDLHLGRAPEDLFAGDLMAAAIRRRTGQGNDRPLRLCHFGSRKRDGAGIVVVPHGLTWRRAR